jgi:hypothetical protein
MQYTARNEVSRRISAEKALIQQRKWPN